MRRAEVYVHDVLAGTLEEDGGRWFVRYVAGYVGPPISLRLPVSTRVYEFDSFPPFFDGLLPEGVMLEGLLRARKLDRHDYLGQLVAVGADLVGAVTVAAVTAAAVAEPEPQ